MFHLMAVTTSKFNRDTVVSFENRKLRNLKRTESPFKSSNPGELQCLNSAGEQLSNTSKEGL